MHIRGLLVRHFNHAVLRSGCIVHLIRLCHPRAIVGRRPIPVDNPHQRIRGAGFGAVFADAFFGCICVDERSRVQLHKIAGLSKPVNPLTGLSVRRQADHWGIRLFFMRCRLGGHALDRDTGLFHVQRLPNLVSRGRLNAGDANGSDRAGHRPSVVFLVVIDLGRHACGLVAGSDMGSSGRLL